MIRNINSTIELIAKVVDGEDLTIKESEKVFSSIFTYDHKGYYLTALISAIHAKGETVDELIGFCNTTKLLGEKINPKVPSDNITDLAGTGGGKIKTINVSTAASFIVAAVGVTVAKQAGYAITSPTGSGDIFRAYGVDNLKLSKKQVEKTLEEVGICPYFISALSPKLKNRSDLSRKVFVENKLHIRSPFHLAAFAYSPTRLKKRIYGCYSEKYLEILAELFIKLGNERTLILHGVGGIPEASNVGKTIIIEQTQTRVKKYTVSPDDFNLKTSEINEIRTGGRVRNIIDFLRILYGKEIGAKRDIVLANASASLYVMGKVKDFTHGTKLAKEIIYKRLASKKLEELIQYLGDQTLYNNWKKKAGI